MSRIYTKKMHRPKSSSQKYDFILNSTISTNPTLEVHSQKNDLTYEKMCNIMGEYKKSSHMSGKHLIRKSMIFTKNRYLSYKLPINNKNV